MYSIYYIVEYVLFIFLPFYVLNFVRVIYELAKKKLNKNIILFKYLSTVLI